MRTIIISTSYIVVGLICYLAVAGLADTQPAVQSAIDCSETHCNIDLED